MKDPNFNAIEDRMLCRLHVLTKERYEALAEAQMKVWRGEVKYELAQKIKDHLTLVYAIETQHPNILFSPMSVKYQNSTTHFLPHLSLTL